MGKSSLLVLSHQKRSEKTDTVLFDLLHKHFIIEKIEKMEVWRFSEMMVGWEIGSNDVDRVEEEEDEHEVFEKPDNIDLYIGRKREGGWDSQ